MGWRVAVFFRLLPWPPLAEARRCGKRSAWCSSDSAARPDARRAWRFTRPPVAEKAHRRRAMGAASSAQRLRCDRVQVAARYRTDQLSGAAPGYRELLRAAAGCRELLRCCLNRSVAELGGAQGVQALLAGAGTLSA